MTKKISENVRRYYDALASNYEKKYDNPLMYYMRDVESSVINEYLKENEMKILDIGCGAGLHVINLAKKGYFVVGTDISQNMINLAAEKSKESNLQNIKFFVHDISQSLQLDENFDIAISMFGTLNHVTDLGRTISNIRNNLKPGGVFIFTIANYWSIFRAKRALKTKNFFKMIKGDYSRISEIYAKEAKRRLWTKLYSKKGIANHLKKEKFEIEKIGGIFFLVRPYYHYQDVKKVGLLTKFLMKIENYLRWLLPIYI